MGLKIFISYSQTDAKPEAKFVVDYLGSIIENSDVFYDQKIKRGDDWKEKILEKLDECDIFVVILTNSGIQSPEVKRELMKARELDKLIIPCKDELLPKSWEELPWEISKENGIQYNGKEDLGKKLVIGITPIEKSKTREEREKYNEYLDERYGIFEIESQILSSSDIFKKFQLEYEEGFNIWRSNNHDEQDPEDILQEDITEEDITEENDPEGEDGN